jgi:hypothetical protein
MGARYNSIEKFKLAIVWNLGEFHFSKNLDKGRKLNTSYFKDGILSPLSEWCSIEADDQEQTQIRHADNAGSHAAKVSTQFFEDNQLKSASYPPFFPNTAPSDFHFLGSVEGCLTGLPFERTK